MKSSWSCLFNHLVDESYVGKCSSGHHKIISSSSPIRVKVLFLNSLRFEPLCCNRGFGDVTSWWNVVGCYRVSKQAEAMSILNSSSVRKLLSDSFEEWWQVNVSWVFSPMEQVTLWSFEFVPSFVSSHSLRIVVFKKFWLDNSIYNFLNLFSSRPNVS